MDNFDIFLRLNSKEISDIELKFDAFPLNIDNSYLPCLDHICYNYTKESAKHRSQLEWCAILQKTLRSYRDYACELMRNSNP